MSKLIVKAACGLLILLVVVGGLAACGEQMAEPDYASQMTEVTAQGMSDGDYAAFTQYLSPEAKATINEADFNTGSQEIKSLIGDYIDKEFQKAETENSYTVVYYKANFSEEPEGVIITVYFEDIDGEMYIAGFLLSSPKIKASLESSGE
ncbi:MAG TPA: DUF3887 domain-containing protein [Dehalococcoidales bacterium]|nr:DUF3887 domain-containing protein [Dehalococcoidales bacterium]